MGKIKRLYTFGFLLKQRQVPKSKYRNLNIPNNTKNKICRNAIGLDNNGSNYERDLNYIRTLKHEFIYTEALATIISLIKHNAYYIEIDVVMSNVNSKTNQIVSKLTSNQSNQSNNFVNKCIY